MQCQDASTELALVSEMVAAVYGTWVVADVRLRLPGDACWFIYNRKTAVHFLVYFMWVHLVYNWCASPGVYSAEMGVIVSTCTGSVAMLLHSFSRSCLSRKRVQSLS